MNCVGHFRSAGGKPAVILPKVFTDHPAIVEADIRPEDLCEADTQSSYEVLKSNGCSRSSMALLTRASVQIGKALRKLAASRTMDDTPVLIPGSDPSYLSPMEALDELVSLQLRHGPLGRHEKVPRRSYRGKVNWRRTVLRGAYEAGAQELPYESTTRRHVKDDPLYTLLYATLQQAVDEYGYRTAILSGNVYGDHTAYRRIRTRAAMTLRATRARYFQDLERRLHSLLCQYYLVSHRGRYGMSSGRFLLSMNGAVLWEELVDSILSDAVIKRQLRDLPDGRRLDHLYVSKLPIHADGVSTPPTYFIGDAKYYDNPYVLTDPEKPAAFKQAGYVHSLVSRHVDALLSKSLPPPTSKDLPEVRDRTEQNYLPVPSFFVFAIKGHAEPVVDLETWLAYGHHEDRLFDRDTVHVGFFGLDFSEALDAYTSHRRSDRRLQQRLRSLVSSSYQAHYAREFNFLFVAHENARRLYEDRLLTLWGRTFFLDRACTQFIFASASWRLLKEVEDHFDAEGETLVLSKKYDQEGSR